MSDIRYKWNDGLNSVQISSDVSLPQFKVLGHRQKTIEASLSTGKMQMLESVMCAVWTTNHYMTDAMTTTTTYPWTTIPWTTATTTPTTKLL